MQEIGAELPLPYNPLNEKGDVKMIPKHDEDFYGWAMGEASLLRQRKWDELDIEHLAEELESMGASEKRELVSRMAQLIFHLLKWQLQAHLRCRSWEGSIETQREELQEIIEDSPSLKPKVIDCFPVAYKKAKSLVKKETPLDLNLLPVECPYTFEQIMNDEFYPE